MTAVVVIIALLVLAGLVLTRLRAGASRPDGFGGGGTDAGLGGGFVNGGSAGRGLDPGRSHRDDA